MYCVYRNQAAAAYSSLYFIIFLFLQFSSIIFFVTLFSGTLRPKRLKFGTRVEGGQMYRVYWNQAAALIHPFISSFFSNFQAFLAHLSRRLTRWAYRIGLEPASVCPCVCPLTISNMNISKTRGPIATKFYLKHHWGGGKPALGFGPGQIRTLVSMATDSSHRVIMGKTASPRFLGSFWSDTFHTCR